MSEDWVHDAEYLKQRLHYNLRRIAYPNDNIQNLSSASVLYSHLLMEIHSQGEALRTLAPSTGFIALQHPKSCFGAVFDVYSGPVIWAKLTWRMFFKQEFYPSRNWRPIILPESACPCLHAAAANRSTWIAFCLRSDEIENRVSLQRKVVQSSVITEQYWTPLNAISSWTSTNTTRHKRKRHVPLRQDNF